MRLRSIQTQLILSMGSALLLSLLIVLGLYAVLVNRLSERYLLEQALPASIQAIANDFERQLTGPLTAAAGIADNSLVQDWLARPCAGPGRPCPAACRRARRGGR